MRKIYNFTVLIAALFIFTACEGDQGEIGPEGPIGEQGADGEDGLTYEVSGFIKGTLEGTRKDGTEFSETFEFTEKRNKEGFEQEGDYYNLSISRILSNYTGSYNSVYLNMNVFDLYGSPEVIADNMYLEFEKEESEDKLFRIAVDYYDEETIINYLIDKNNTNYEFIDGGRNPEYIYENSTNIRIFDLTDGSKVKYEDAYENYNYELGYSYGEFVSLTTVDGSVITTGTKYANLELRSDDNITSFYENQNNLGSQVIIPADSHEISNFTYNVENSTVTFDFIYNIEGGREYYNSTNNDLTFTGSVEAEVYSEIMNRTAN